MSSIALHPDTIAARARLDDVRARLKSIEARRRATPAGRWGTLETLAKEEEELGDVQAIELELLHAWASREVSPVLDAASPEFERVLEAYLAAAVAAEQARLRAIDAREALIARLREPRRIIAGVTASLGQSIDPPTLLPAPAVNVSDWVRRTRSEFIAWRKTWAQQR